MVVSMFPDRYLCLMNCISADLEFTILMFGTCVCSGCGVWGGGGGFGLGFRGFRGFRAGRYLG